jgi:esterase
VVLESFQVGTGDVPTVLLHGFLGTGRNLRSLAVAWTKADPRRRILLPDLTGHGASQAPAPDAGLSAVARDVVETLDAQGFSGPVDWVGHSMGGRVALTASEDFSDRVRSVAMLDIAPGPVAVDLSEGGNVLDILLRAPPRADNRRELRANLTGNGLSESLTDWLLMNLVPDGDGVRWRFDREALRRLHQNVTKQDLWPAMERPVHPPLRCIRGGRSRYVTAEDVQRMEAADCPVATLPDAGHFVHVDNPQELLAWLMAP